MVVLSSRYSVLDVETTGFKVELAYCRLKEDGVPNFKIEKTVYSDESPIKVELANIILTAAQENAKELEMFLRIAVLERQQGSKRITQWVKDAKALLAKLPEDDPNEPPTLADALSELHSICNSRDDESEYAAMQRAGILIARARRFGLF